MATYPALQNGAAADFSRRSWIRLEQGGTGTLRCNDGNRSGDFAIDVRDLVNLGLAVEVALTGRSTSFIRRNGNMLSVEPVDGVDGAVRFKGKGSDWSSLRGHSPRLLQEFCLATLRALGVLPVTITSFSSPQFDTYIQQTNIQINNF